MGHTSNRLTILLSILFGIACVLPSTVQANWNRWSRSKDCYIPHFDVGVMGGYTGGERRAYIENLTTATTFRQSSARDSFEAGLQLRALFGSEYYSQPFIYLQGLKTLGPSNSIRIGRINSPSNLTSYLNLETRWLSRLGIGVDSPWLYDIFKVGMGAGIAVLNQTLKSYIGDATGTTMFQTTRTSIRPTVMLEGTWCFCENGLLGKQAKISAQVHADSNPGIHSDGSTSTASYQTSIRQKWVPRADLVFLFDLY